MQVTAVVEGPSDEGAVRSILRSAGLTLAGAPLGLRGRSHIERNIGRYNKAAEYSPWFVLMDLDDPADCPFEIRRRLLGSAENVQLVFRIAVVELETWLLADVETAARFLGVSTAKVPKAPETIRDPKEFLLMLARQSRHRRIREGLVPRVGSGAAVGAEYVGLINEFADQLWRPEVAAESSPSLARCLQRLRTLASTEQSS